MAISHDLLDVNRELWQRITTHPFVRAAGDGTLPSEAFDRWIVEDHFFVVGFRRFLGRLVELAPDEPARDLIAGSLAPLQAELELFRSAAAERGLDLDVEPCPTNLGYTSYVLAAPADGWAVAMTVLYGAEQAYHDAWRAVRDQAAAESPYWSFIDNWSSEPFAAWVDELAGLLDRTVPAPTREVERTFERVVRFELAFWDAVHHGEQWPQHDAARAASQEQP